MRKSDPDNLYIVNVLFMFSSSTLKHGGIKEKFIKSKILINGTHYPM